MNLMLVYQDYMSVWISTASFINVLFDLWAKITKNWQQKKLRNVPSAILMIINFFFHLYLLKMKFGLKNKLIFQLERFDSDYLEKFSKKVLIQII